MTSALTLVIAFNKRENLTMGNNPVLQPKQPEDQLSWLLIFACWLVATIATLGSLFMSEVIGMQPCVLCWWQRIFIYPLVVVFAVSLFPLDRNVVRYALPIAVLGWCFAIYHYLLYVGFIPENLQPCGEGPSCAEVNLEMFGFITIPMLSILSYTSIIIMLSIIRNRALK